MGHDTHFLSRLSRASLAQTEHALALYRDPALVQALLAELDLPDGADRLAIALDDGAQPAHVVVSRDGHFVTCLGAGMTIGDIPRVGFAKLQGLRARHQRLREALDLSGSGRLRRASQRLSDNPMIFSREDAELLAAAHPLLGDALASSSVQTLDVYVKLAASLVGDGGSGSLRTERLRMLWKLQWFMGHAMVAAVAHGPTAAMRASTAPLVAEAWASFGAHCALLRPTGLRLLWALARLGGRAIPMLKQQRARLTGANGLRVACLALTMIGLRQAKHRAEVTKALQSIPTSSALDPTTQAAGQELLASYSEPLLAQLADPEKARLEAAAALERVRAEGLCPNDGVGPGTVIANTYTVKVGAELPTWHEASINVLSWLATAELPELYAPAGTYDGEASRADMEHLVHLGRRSLGLRTQPIRVSASPGRNAPCGCGSGKKSKRCCAA